MSTDLSHRTVADEQHLALVLEGRAPLVEDGAMGTMLQRTGLLAPGEPPEGLSLSAPEAVTAVHRAYVEAGAQLVTANTFGASALKPDAGLSVDEVFAAAVACARAAKPRYVAASLGPTGRLLEPWGDLDPDDASGLFAAQARAAEAAGADVIVVETMTDLGEAEAAARAALDVTDLPVFVTLSFGAGGRTMMGVTPEDAARALTGWGVHAAGLNCSVGPREAAPLAAAMARCSAARSSSSPMPACRASRAARPSTTWAPRTSPPPWPPSSRPAPPSSAAAAAPPPPTLPPSRPSWPLARAPLSALPDHPRPA